MNTISLAICFIVATVCAVDLVLWHRLRAAQKLLSRYFQATTRHGDNQHLGDLVEIAVENPSRANMAAAERALARFDVTQASVNVFHLKPRQAPWIGRAS